MIKLEFFRDNSQICISSGIRDEIVRDAISFLKKEPAEVRGIRDWKGRVRWNGGRHPQNTCLFDIMFNDAIITCHCRECWKHFSQGPQETSDYVWSFFNGIARKVKDSGTPGYLTTMAYADYKLPPRMPIEKNLLVMVAITGPWAEFRPEKRKEDMERLAKWHEKLGQKTWLYTYAGKFKEGRPVGIPHTTPRALGAFVKQARPHIFGFYLSNYCDRIFFNYLTNYVYGKLSWNTELDVEQLLDEHARNLYGPAAGPVREFFETVEKIWGRIASNVEETPLGPVFMFPTDAALWSEFYTPAVRKRFAALFAEAERLAKNDPTVAARLRLLKQEMYQPMLDEARRFEEINDAAAAWSCHFPERKLPVKIDGRPEEPAWRDAASFYLHGLKGAPAEVRSVVKVMHDKENFYFAFECEEPQTQRMESNRHPKDGPVWKDCTAEVFLSPDGNRQHCYQLMVNPNGAFGDLEVFRDPRRNNARYDYKWESGAEVKCSVTPGKAWYAEMRVPRSAMCAAMPEGILANFARHRVLTGGKREEQFYVWSPYVRSFGDTELFGSLKFEPEPGKNLIADPDFAGKVLPRRTFGKWWSTEPLKRDEKIFVTCGSSVRQEGGKKSRQLIQYLPPLKPETVYELSFFVRMDKVERQPGMPSWHVRVDMGDNRPVFHPQFPESLHGTFPWRRQRFLIKTGTAQGSAGKPYVNFVLKPNSGTVWIDNVKFVEVPQK